ncbi:MAG: NAD-dependent epimerase/dehydratase family protein [Dermatophilaceae bacterium]
MNTVLLTGAAGFIGSHVGEMLLERGWRIRGVDALTDTYDPAAKLRNLALLDHSSLFEFVHADLATVDLRPLLDGIDAVIHLAAEPGVSKSWGTVFPTYVNRNVLSTQRLLEAVADRPIDRFVYASSSSVYGPNSGTMHESSVLAPLSPYGVSKLAGECLVGAYAQERQLPAVSLRFFSVYGPRQRPDMAIHRFVEALLDGRPAEIYGQEVQLRDFTYVGDVAAAVVGSLTAPVAPGTVLNIAYGDPVAIPDVLRMVEAEVGGRLDVAQRPHRAGDTGRTHGDSSAAREVLGWAPTVDLATGLARQVAWHRAVRHQPVETVAAVGPVAAELRGPVL